MKPNSGLTDASRVLIYLVLAALGICSLLVLAIAGFGTRLGLWYFRTGFTVLKYAGFLGVAVAILSAALGFQALSSRNIRGLYLAFFALVCGIVAFGIPFSWKLKAQRYPRIHDITTDVTTPPGFVDVIPQRGGPVPYGGPSIAALQVEAYPDLRTLVLPVPADLAFKSALDTAKSMGWKIVAAVPAEGRIEATDTTFWFGFKDDIVIRITPAENKSLLDIRSVSRVGISDVGTNAKRIRTFLKKIQQQSPLRQNP